MTRDEDPDHLAAEYVLGLLEGADAARAERMLASDARSRQRSRAGARRFAELDATAAPVAVSDALWTRIEAGLDGAAAMPVRRGRRSLPIRATLSRLCGAASPSGGSPGLPAPPRRCSSPSVSG